MSLTLTNMQILFRSWMLGFIAGINYSEVTVNLTDKECSDAYIDLHVKTGVTLQVFPIRKDF